MSRPKHVETNSKWNIYLIVASSWCFHLSCRNIYNISQNSKFPITTDVELWSFGNFYSILHVTPPWYVFFGHMTLGVEHTARNYQSFIISPESKTDIPRKQTSGSASLLFWQKENYYYQSRRSYQKTQFPNRIPPQHYSIFQWNPSNTFYDAFFTVLPNSITTHSHIKSTPPRGNAPVFILVSTAHSWIKVLPLWATLAPHYP